MSDSRSFDPDVFMDDILGIIDDTRARRDHQQLLNIYDSLALAMSVGPEEINEVLEDIEASIAQVDHTLSEIQDAEWRIDSRIIEGYYPSMEIEVRHDGNVVFKTQLDRETALLMQAKRERERRH